MKSKKILLLGAMICSLIFGLGITSCQKMYRPPLVLIPDPPPPPYNPLKSYFSFENNLTDSGELKLSATGKNITYGAGVAGQAAKIGADGYILIQDVGDTIKNLGSFTFAWWMNGPTGPVTGGAQGILSIANKNEFWGNLEIFLENYSNPADPNAVFMKIHLLNGNAATGNGEEWIADDNLKMTNVLNKWTHFALTYNAATSKLSLYKDGVPTATYNKTLGGGTYGAVKFNNVTGMTIGNFSFQTIPTLANHGPEPWAKPFNGSIDQVRIYNKALTDAEVSSLFTSKR
ncbi:MAG: LamG domain-containing protein [Chitinophagaceae bacterium]